MSGKKSFYVRLISDGSLDIYPSNTLTSFTNVLANPISTPKNENWRVALHSIVSSNNFFSDKKLSHLKVRCDQVQPWYQLTKEISVHARKRYHPEKARAHTFSPLHKEYYEVPTDEISKLSIHLETNYDLSYKRSDRTSVKLVQGQPTIVTLHFQSMSDREAMESPISIRVTNRRDDFDYQPSNSFKVNLPAVLSKTLENAHNYEIALASATYRPGFPQFQNVPNNCLEVGFTDATTSEAKMAKIPLDLEQNFASVIKLVGVLNLAIRKAEKQMGGTRVALMKIDPNRSGRLKVVFYAQAYIKFPYQLAQILGNDDKPDNKSQVKISGDGAYYFKNPVRFASNYPNYIFLVANFVEPSPVANIYSPILKTIPINVNRERNAQHQTFQSVDLEYHPLLFSDLENLQFQFYTHTGELVKFTEEKHDVNLTLFLRRKRK